MKYIKKLIVILIIICIALIISLLFLLNKDEEQVKIAQNTTIIEEEQYTTLGDGEINFQDEAQEVTSENSFYLVESGIQKYIESIRNSDTDALLNLLSSKYKEENNIVKGNVLQYVNNISSAEKFKALKMNYLQSQNYDVYAVYGKLIKQGKYIGEMYTVLTLNTGELTFSITPVIWEYNNVKEIAIQKYEGTIQENTNNKITYLQVTELDILKNIIKDYQYLVFTNIEESYEKLNEEYREKRFGNLESYKNYITLNEKKLKELEIILCTKGDEKGEYIIEDSYSNRYIIQKTGIVDYKILLDDYTILSETQTNLYLQSTDEYKVKNNIEKFIKMINTKDYKNAYNLLYEQFKSNFFKEERNFIEYVQNNLFEYNYIENIQIKEENNIFICTVLIKSENKVAASSQEKIFMIQLEEQTDFKISFPTE